MLTFQIMDEHKLHNGYRLSLHPGYTALIGPNGAGKTTLLHQIRKLAEERKDISIWKYSNEQDGGHYAKDYYIHNNQAENLCRVLFSSEGEQVVVNLGARLKNLKAAIQDAKSQGKKLLILFDAVDSGLSIDRARELRGLLDIIAKDGGDFVYLVVSANQYELVCKGVRCLNVRTGKSHRFSSYDKYATFVCGYEKDYPRPQE